MIHALAVLTFAMLGFMFWSTAFRLRRDRVRATKRSDRSGIILTRRQRVRASLSRAFTVPAQRPEWEAGLLANLGERQGHPANGD